MSKYKIGDVVLYRPTLDAQPARDWIILEDDGANVLMTQYGNTWSSSIRVPYNQVRSQYTHISPSALKTFTSNLDEFYMKYMSFNKPPAIPQNQPMSIGSAFDAYAKSYIINALTGGKIPEGYSFEELFEKQVEPHNRDWARRSGKYAFDSYKKSGALADLMLEINGSDIEPRFEFEVKGIVKAETGDIKVQGRPDLKFHTKEGASVVIDWKVNNFCGKSDQSPKPHYNMSRDGWDVTESPNSRSHRQQHPKAMLFVQKGIQVNVASQMEIVDQDWAVQLCVYAWLLGEPIGSDFVNGIEQLACSPFNAYPKIRVSTYRLRTSKEFQMQTLKRLQFMTEVINSDHIFRMLSYEDSLARCKHLDSVALSLHPTGDAKKDWLSKYCR